MIQRAADLGAKIQAEDGIARAVAVVQAIEREQLKRGLTRGD
jgi:hypothetical protein